LAAGVAAAQGGVDVGRAGVVVKLGLGQGFQQGALVVTGGKVQEGARDRGAWKTGIEEEVFGAQAALV
jgi:hypothetical protein